MGRIQLLDCTLRDGGYVNDWNFGHNNLISIFERLVNARIDIVEVGFIDERRKLDINRSILPDTRSFEEVYGKCNHKDTMVVGMIDYGTCSLSNLQPCNESILDGIRVIFKKDKRKEAVEYCAKVKALGYKVFVQLVSITSYNDEELQDLIKLANDIEPYAVSMVDTYGLLQKDSLLHYFYMLDEGLKENISLGYHSHNNFQRAFANCQEMLLCNTKRDVLVDATVYGMGKSAGNCPIELLAMHLNDYYNKNYDISQILEALDCNIMDIYKTKPWGYNMFFYMAAFNSCHPSYVSYLMDKENLSVRQINEILSELAKSEDKQLMYDEQFIKQLYDNYKKTITDISDKSYNNLKKDLYNQNIIVKSAGVNQYIIVKSDVDDSRVTVSDNNRTYKGTVIWVNSLAKDITISYNSLTDKGIDDKSDQLDEYVFISDSKSYVNLSAQLSDRPDTVKIITLSDVTPNNGDHFDYVFDKEEFKNVIGSDEAGDNSLYILKSILGKCGFII